MVEAPFAAKAAGCVDHSANGYGQNKHLPGRAVQRVDVRKAGKAQGGCKLAERECDAADERAAAQAKDGEAGRHHSSNVVWFGRRSSRMERISVIRSLAPGGAGWPPGLLLLSFWRTL